MGGKAFEGVTRRILQGEIETTLRWLQNKWTASYLNGGHLSQHLLGSAGQLDPYQDAGDLDLNLHIDRYDQAQVAQDLIALLGVDHVKPRPGNNQIFTAVPIDGNPLHGFVQVDFMFGDYEWQKFSYWSSKRAKDVSWGNRTITGFKGLYRTELIKAITAFNSDWVLEENGQMIARVGPTFFHDKGLVWRYRHRPMRKDGTARVKALEELSEEEFLKIYPSAVTAKADVIKDPKVVAHLLFNEHVDVHDLNTIEYISQLLRRHYDNDQRKKILEIFYERLSSLKVEIPEKEFRMIWLR